MLRIDDHYFCSEDLMEFHKKVAIEFSAIDFYSYSAKRIAVCTPNMVEWLALVLYCKERGLSIASVHPDTPFSTALLKAESMKCDALWWQNIDGLQLIEQADNKNTKSRKSGMIQMSSGTTGAPKIIERSWAEIDEEIAAYNAMLGLSPDTTPVLVCSVTHSYGLICGVLASLARGATPHVLTSWNPKYAHRILSNYADAILYSSPPFIHSIIQMFPQPSFPYAVMTSGTLLPESWFVTMKARFRHFFQQYGCSEIGCTTIAKNPRSGDIIGRPLPHLCLTTNPDQNSLDTPAELVVVAKGKIVHTQDLVFQDKDGDWHFVSRLDDTIIVSGINVYPQEVENGIAHLPGIEEVVVYRKSDDLVGQRVAAVYVASREIPQPELRTWCTQYLARHQWPSFWQRVTSIPRMNNGKISRRMLAEMDLAPYLVSSEIQKRETIV